MFEGIEPCPLSGFLIKQHSLIPKRMNGNQLEGCSVKCSVCNTWFDACITQIYLVYYTDGWISSNTIYRSAIYACSLDCANFFVLQRMG
jgi:hypothetical protein